MPHPVAGPKDLADAAMTLALAPMAPSLHRFEAMGHTEKRHAMRSLRALRSCQPGLVAGCLAAGLAVVLVAAADRRGKGNVLHIGTSGCLMPGIQSETEKAAL